ncbi:PP2C family protein-serine/threonine phosphatase [Spirillospora sp. CA-294931]|uniref:PP2C family protein-serine/threonine phosphatase n=1 Tax=Spirillospora sp. CA-294931 TaxID=3240042 RepID=UPI003D9423FC
MSTISHHRHPVTPGADDRIDLLLIDDEPADVFLVERMLDDSGLAVAMTVADSLEAARRLRTRRTQCIVVDLSAAETDRLEVLREVLDMSGRAAVIVLTSLKDAHLGIQAVAAGAADYLVKQEVDGPLLARAIRYAIERKRAEETERRLVEARILGRENARLERGLLPVPLIDDASLRHHARYRPGRRRALLGGDFYDTVQTEGGAVHLMIGDVSGHGPDEAALGVQLRMAWRTLVLAGHSGEQLLGTLDTVLGHERRSEEIFTTLCMVTIAPSRRTARMHLAGHPAPLLFREDDDGKPKVSALPGYAHGPALGLVPGAEWPTTEIDLGESWGLMLYTDGLIEGRVGEGAARLGTEGLVDLAAGARGRGATGRALIDTLVTEVEDLNGDALTDDLAVLLLTRTATPC